MNRAANVTNVEALDRVRAALCVFGEEASQVVEELRSEADRFVEWLAHDQFKHWQHEIRVREDKVNEAKLDLHRCQSATIDPQRTPSCLQEKKVLEAARRRLEQAEQKLAAVRRWIPQVRQAVIEFRAQVEPLAGAVAADLPRAVAQLRSMSEQLAAYLDLAPAPAAVVAGPSSGAPAGAALAPEQPEPPNGNHASLLPVEESASAKEVR